jgi:excisionase family DNA binding protein
MTTRDDDASPKASRSAPRAKAAREPGDAPGSTENSTSGGSLGEVRFLTVAEVAAVMRVSKMTVYRLVHGGELPAVRVGRSFRVPEKAVHDYLESAFIEAG